VQDMAQGLRARSGARAFKGTRGSGRACRRVEGGQLCRTQRSEGQLRRSRLHTRPCRQKVFKKYGMQPKLPA
jgi:hypothetical protein